MVSSGEKNYEYFIGYKDDDHKITPLHIMLVKKIAYVKICKSFLFNMMNY